MTKSSEPTHYWFIFQGNHLLLPLPNVIDDHAFKSAFLREFKIASIDQNEIYCAELPLDHPLPSSCQSIPIRQAIELLGEDWFNLTAKAITIIHWDRNHQYCGRCGAPTHHHSTSFERICSVCSQVYYPRISPSIVVLISRGNDILMARSPHFAPGVYALIAGFVEGGESIENAVHREVQEEVGIKIKHLAYFGSQAWPFPDSLMFAFTAEYESGELVIDSHELEAAGWYPYNQLPGRPSTNLSLSAKLLDHFIRQQTAHKGK